MLDERAIRVIEAASALFGVPLLVLTASWSWATRGRASLPPWRNGIGLTAVVIVSWWWLWFGVSLIGLSPSTATFSVKVLEMMTAIGTLVSPLCALAWRGRPRLYAIAATVLMIVGAQSIVYT